MTEGRTHITQKPCAACQREALYLAQGFAFGSIIVLGHTCELKRG